MGIADSVKKGLDARDQCLKNDSLVQVATSLGVFDASAFNMTKLAKDQLDKVNLNSITNWNAASTVSLSQSPTQKFTDLSNLNFASLDSGVTSLNTAINTDIPTLISNLQSFKTQMNTAMTNLAVGDLTYTGSPSGTLQAAAVTDCKAKMQAIITKLDNEIALSNTILTTCTSMRDKAVTLKSTAQSTQVRLL